MRLPRVLTSAPTRAGYVRDLLELYRALPDTPERSYGRDRQQAERWFAGGVPWERAEAALLLGSLRRLLRPPDSLGKLGRIRSLTYFQPVVDELTQQPPLAGYVDYLRHKLTAAARGKSS